MLLTTDDEIRSLMPTSKWNDVDVIKSIKVIKIYSTFCISHTTRTNGLLYLTGHNECPLLTILLT